METFFSYNRNFIFYSPCTDVRDVSSELSASCARRCLFSAYSGNQAENAQAHRGHAGVFPAAREAKRQDLSTCDKTANQAISD